MVMYVHAFCTATMSQTMLTTTRWIDKTDMQSDAGVTGQQAWQVGRRLEYLLRAARLFSCFRKGAARARAYIALRGGVVTSEIM